MNVEIADRLASRRKEAGYSQEELAMQLGVSRQAVSKWERSESSPDTNNLIALAKLYDVSLDDLLYVDGSIEDDVEFEIQDRAADWDDDDAEPLADEIDEDDAEFAQDLEEEYDEDDEGIDEDEKTGFLYNDGEDYVHISWRDGINVKDSKKGEQVHVGWDGVHVVDAGDDPTNITWAEGEGVNINGVHYESWREAAEAYDPRKNVWLTFPYPILATLVFFWIGFAYSQWAVGALVFLTIPLYYMLIQAFVRRSFDTFLTALYAIGSTAWFIWAGLAQGVWHPNWLIFLTIPLFGWLSHALFGKKKKKSIEQ
ncbi:MAG: helix-turn-helix domain-containing protein [Coriobacteriia bacterium]|nr:helix-turn-helix domain-containing protein [Coriobacteriia bacterium]